MEDAVEGGKGTMQSKATFFKLPVFQNELDLFVNWHTAERQVTTFVFMVKTNDE